MTTYINSNDYSSKLNTILDLARAAGYLTSNEVAAITAVVNTNLNWQELNFSDIENWLNENSPTPAPTEAPTQTQPTQTSSATQPPTIPSPTQSTSGPNGSNSLIASFTIVAFCAFGKLFI